MIDSERDLWARHLHLKRCISSAQQGGRLKEARKLEEEFEALEDRLFRKWRCPAIPKREPERFAYPILVLDGETGRRLGYKIADQDGVHDPDGLDHEFPANSSHREWMREIEPSKVARDKAAAMWKTLGHSGRPCCPGCRRRETLVYVEFRNWDESARFKIPYILAVCDGSAASLLERSRTEFFGVTALGTLVSWPCAPSLESIEIPQSEPPTAVERAGPGRGGWRGKHQSIQVLNRIRKARAAKRGDSLSAESA